MPRVSIRKLFIYFLAVASCILLALNIQQRTVGLFSPAAGGFPSGPGLTGNRLPISGPGPSAAGAKSGEEDAAKSAEEEQPQADDSGDAKSRRRKALNGQDLVTTP
jgi:hypothetical protein